MPIDWSHATRRYLYTEEDAAFGRLPVLVRSFAAELIKFCDRAGVITLGPEDAVTVICRRVGAHAGERRQLRKIVPDLIADGYLASAPGAVFIRNFCDAHYGRDPAKHATMLAERATVLARAAVEYEAGGGRARAERESNRKPRATSRKHKSASGKAGPPACAPANPCEHEANANPDANPRNLEDAPGKIAPPAPPQTSALAIVHEASTNETRTEREPSAKPDATPRKDVGAAGLPVRSIPEEKSLPPSGAREAPAAPSTEGGGKQGVAPQVPETPSDHARRVARKLRTRCKGAINTALVGVELEGFAQFLEQLPDLGFTLEDFGPLADTAASGALAQRYKGPLSLLSMLGRPENGIYPARGLRAALGIAKDIAAEQAPPAPPAPSAPAARIVFAQRTGPVPLALLNPVLRAKAEALIEQNRKAREAGIPIVYGRPSDAAIYREKRIALGMEQPAPPPPFYPNLAANG
jgi:hypothetical protein